MESIGIHKFFAIICKYGVVQQYLFTNIASGPTHSDRYKIEMYLDFLKSYKQIPFLYTPSLDCSWWRGSLKYDLDLHHLKMLSSPLPKVMILMVIQVTVKSCFIFMDNPG